MSSETQARRRKDKRKKKGRAEAPGAERWEDDFQPDVRDDDQFYVEPDSVSDEGTGDEEIKEHHSEGGSSCLTVLVFLVLLAGVGVLLALFYVQSQGIAHVDTPAPPPAAAPRMETIVETIVESVDSSPPAADQGEGAPAGQQEGDAPAQVVEQVIEEHIVYVDAPAEQQQVVYVEAPPAGIQLEGSEPQLEEAPAAAPPPPPPSQQEEGVVTEEKLVRMRQVVKQMTDADGTVREEIVSEEVLEDDAEEPATDQAPAEPDQQQQSEEAAAADTDEGVDVTEPVVEEPREVAEEEAKAVEDAEVADEAEVAEEAEVTEEAEAAEEAEVAEEAVVAEEPEVVDDVEVAVEDAPQEEAPEAVVEEEKAEEVTSEAAVEEQAAPAVDEGIVADVEDDSPDAAGEYDKADVTGPEDWDIRAELDAADNLVDTDDAAALSAFGAILARRPRSPRALWGRARALNAQATRERSNNLLDKAIKAFRDVLDLDLEAEVPLQLYRQAAESCVQQMRFRGQLDQAARIQQRLIQKFPDDYMLRNHLATVFMTYGQNAAAEEVLQEVLRLWPDNGYAKVHLGFIRRQEGNHSAAVTLMQAGIDSDEPGVHDKRFYYALGDSYDRTGRRDLALKVYEEGVKRGLLLSVLQRSLINVDRLTGRPYWTPEQTGSQALISELEAQFPTIRGEMLALLDSERPEDGFQPEQEQLSKEGDWKQYTMYRRGRKNQYACVKTPRTCEIIDKFPEAAGCRRGQVKFSMLAPGSTVWPHTGPTNCRLRLHLGIKVPPGTGIRVAGEKRTWEEGKVLIIDDSFEHDVWNEGTESRFVLIVDIWHPELTEDERRTLTSI
ncbi:aspartyl/asparaginyl beta-hydroxylase-like isoform X5 [Amphibalanus amphitrite]|uniref:aspartyl/asparaginyl beta-hydroxylase-like isoform X5 n=1 Tax=Amphibalanus amphitrite TaxID=1232801 RepID=UPI001C902FA7|nr:aspartyl/asparaginyl beta-hydroxylase-like isoform X5 [Amphibalanus amphitrite]